LQDNASDIQSFFQLCQSLCSVAVKDLIANGSFENHSTPKELSHAEIFVLSGHFKKKLLVRLLELGFYVNRQSLERKISAFSINNGRIGFHFIERREKIIQSLKVSALFLQSNSDSSPSPATIFEVDSFATVNAIILRLFFYFY
jgi:hypothetical protein